MRLLTYPFCNNYVTISVHVLYVLLQYINMCITSTLMLLVDRCFAITIQMLTVMKIMQYSIIVLHGSGSAISLVVIFTALNELNCM